MKTVLTKAGLITAPLALAIGVSAALAAPQWESKPCFKLGYEPT